MKIKSSGFTLTELMIVISIMTVIFVVLFPARNSLSERRRVTNLAYQFALYIREASFYSMAEKGYYCSTNGQTTYNNHRAIHLYKVNQNRIEIRNTVDNNKDGFLIGEFSTCYSDYDHMMTLALDRFCWFRSTGSEVCTNSSGQQSGNAAIRQLIVMFVRPDPKPVIIFKNGSDGIPSTALADPSKPITFYFKPPWLPGYEIAVKLEPTGQVTVYEP